ncbi:hypothetical protein [Ktedonobacter racemifer]|uniref:Uncharacterized protein n=1 Tax=Ktedonobacter racemifer DSM 44963 TaxID=485913 RepID=D6U5E5_KTERA|nr:hypothetical protein [Ktedonobacter racemifer]EFH81725.1 hypothetical protein Krac_2469 [Ktedonobacter racemifer DSM 44963]
MSLLALFRRQTTQPPMEVIQAACEFYGRLPERVPILSAEKLRALSDDVWVVRINEHESAVVAYTPGSREGAAIAAPWYE